MFAASMEYGQAMLLQITFTKYFAPNPSSYNQYIFGISAVVVLISYLFFRIWYRHFCLSSCRITVKGVVFLAVFWVFSAAFGVAGYYQFKTNPAILATTSVALCPVLVSAITFFSMLLVYSLAHWRVNDFSFHKQEEGGNKTIDIQQCTGLAVLYISLALYGLATTLFYNPGVVGYTVAAWLLIVWCGGLAVWEYIGKRYEWGVYSVLNVVQSLGLVAAWSVVYLEVSYADSKEVQNYVLFWILAALSLGSLIFALICFIDTQYTLKPTIYILFALSFICAVIAFAFLWFQWISIIFICFIVILSYFIFLYILYKRNNHLHFVFKLSIWVIIVLAIAGVIVLSALTSSTAVLLVAFGLLLGAASGILAYLYVERVKVENEIRWEQAATRT